MNLTPLLAAHLGRRSRSNLCPHPAWLALGATAADRTAAYRQLLDEARPEDDLADIRLTCNSNAPGAAMTFAPWSKPRPVASPDPARTAPAPGRISDTRRERG